MILIRRFADQAPEREEAASRDRPQNAVCFVQRHERYRGGAKGSMPSMWLRVEPGVLSGGEGPRARYRRSDQTQNQPLRSTLTLEAVVLAERGERISNAPVSSRRAAVGAGRRGRGARESQSWFTLTRGVVTKTPDSRCAAEQQTIPSSQPAAGRNSCETVGFPGASCRGPAGTCHDSSRKELREHAPPPKSAGRRAAELGAALALLCSLACSSEHEPSDDRGAPRVSTCVGDYEPCGGNLVGEWETTEICIEGDINAELNAAIFGNRTACEGAVSSADITIFRSLVFNELCVVTTESTLCPLRETGEYGGSYHVVLQPECFEEFTGRPLSSDTCSALQSEMESSVVSASCNYDGIDCQCQMNERDEVADSEGAIAYWTDGTVVTITYSSGSVGVGTFCVEEDRMTWRIPYGMSFVVEQFARR